MLRKALIITVGTGTRPDVKIVRPLVKSVKDSHPDYTVFVATEDSRKHAEEIAQILVLGQSLWTVKILKQYDDVQAVFREVSKVIRQVINQGFTPGDIQVDFTSGTKAMSAGAVLAAVHHNCDSLKYITGERGDGVVKDGTERFVGLCPHAIYANRDITTASELIKKLRFQPAMDTLDNINRNLLDQDDLRLVDSLKAVAEAYNYWDRFEHIKFRGAINKSDWQFQELHLFRVEDHVVKAVHRIGEILREDSFHLEEDVLLDLFNNAERRAMEGRYDDALARLYRLAEMIAQYVLLTRHQINTGDVDLSKVPLDLHEALEAHREATEGNKIKIGLRISYEILAALGEEIGKKYLMSKRLRHLLNERNATILAHGNMPVTPGLYQALKKQLVDLLISEIVDFEKKACSLNFPWLRAWEAGVF